MIKIFTERLILREYESTDWLDIHQYAQLENILIYENWGPNTEEDTKAYVQKTIEERNENPRRAFDLCITLKDSDKLIGGCRFMINAENIQNGHFGYIIHPHYWHQGYATEASKALLDFMIENYGVSEIEATCDVLNLPSQRVLAKCGLLKINEVKNHYEMKGRIRDTFYYQMMLK